MRKMFLSFSGLLRLLRDGRVAEEELVDGLFCFDAVRSYVLDPRTYTEGKNDVVRVFENGDMERGWQIHALLVRVVLKAEEEGRVDWRPQDGYHTLEGVRALFERNGYPGFDARDPEKVFGPDIRQWIQESGVEIEVPF